MIDGRSVLALVTARGGSTGLPRKNLKEVGGKTLIARAVEVGQRAASVDRVVLSSDDPEIIQAAILAGCEVPFLRPAGLASDEARSIDVVRHALEMLPEGHDLVVLLQPTSPLRSAEDIEAALELCVRHAAPACVSVCAADKPPFWMHGLDERLRLRPILPGYGEASRRQDLPQAFAVNGAVYVARTDWIRAQDSFVGPETIGYVMPRERSIDIDDELDLIIADALARRLEDDTQKGRVRSAGATGDRARLIGCRPAQGTAGPRSWKVF
jgi:N-acylneuraminate cytidylyltransferase